MARPLPGVSGVRRANTNSKFAPDSARGATFWASPPVRSSIDVVHTSAFVTLSAIVASLCVQLDHVAVGEHMVVADMLAVETGMSPDACVLEGACHILVDE